MLNVPLTLVFDYANVGDSLRPYVMREFVENGCPNLVMTTQMISGIMQNPSFEKRLRQDLASSGATLVDAHAPFGPNEDLDVVDPEARAIMLDRLKIAIRIASRFGIETMTVHTGNGHRAIPGYTSEQYHDAIIRSLEELLPLAASFNMFLCIENIWFETNTPEQLLDIIDKVQAPNLGICYDSGHANLMTCDRGFEDSQAIRAFKDLGPVPYDDRILEKLLPHVVSCHLHDNHGQDDEHLLPGKGDIDWAHVMGLLKQAPRLKCVQSEVIPVRVQTPIAELCRVFKELMAM